MRGAGEIHAEALGVLGQMVGTYERLAEGNLTRAEATELKAHIRLTEAKVRQLIGECTESARQLQAATALARERSATGSAALGIAGALIGSKSRGMIARAAAADRRRLAANSRAAIQPYRNVAADLRTRLASLATVRAGLQTALTEAKSHAARKGPVTVNAPLLPKSPGVVTAPPQWLPDPTRRYQYRWWDGTRWTDSVANNGTAAVDPIPPE